MSELATPPPVARARRRCGPRPIDPGSPRPSDLLRMFFLAGLVYITAAGLAAVAYGLSGRGWLHWLSLHLLLLGGVSQLVLGAGQFFAGAFLATDPPPRRLIAAQLAAWNVGTLLVAAGVPTGVPVVVDAGAAVVVGGLVLFAEGLRGMQRRSLQRAPWAIRWYRASAACLSVGALLGALMASGMSWSAGSLLGAHLALNIAGWLGTAIVGTLHTFFPSLTQTHLRHPRLQQPTYVGWLLGVVALAFGAAFGSHLLLAAGWAALLFAAALLTANLLGSARAAPRPVGLPPRLLALAQAFLLAGLALALIVTVAGNGEPLTGSTRSVLAVLLLAGWVGLTVAGSLLHLLAILGRIRRFALAMPTPRPGRDRALTAASALAVAALAVSRMSGMAPLSLPATVLILAVSAVLAARLIVLAVRALAPRPTPDT